MFSIKPKLDGGVDVINAVDNGRFPLLMSRVAQGVLHNKGANVDVFHVFSSAELEKLQVSLELDEASLKTLLNSLNFILKQAAYHVAKPAALKEQLVSEGLTDEKASACAQAWANVAKPTIDALRQCSLYPLQLEGVKWSLETRISSSSQTAQHETLARLQMCLANQDESKKETVNIEMSHPELFQLYTQLEQIQSQLDSLK